MVNIDLFRFYAELACCVYLNLLFSEGTGCRASVHIDLPFLVAKIGLHGIDDICARYGCQARGSTGEFSEVTQSAKVDISNRYRLGHSEVALVEQMIVAVNTLAEMEVAEQESKQ